MANFIFCAVSVNNSIFLRKQQERKFLMKIISLMTPPQMTLNVKVHDFRGTTVADINHYIIPI